MDVALNPAPVRWPFWWLALAWLCANIPAPARLELIDWLGGLQHFSHQAQLSTQVRAALKTLPANPSISSSKTVPAKSAVPLAAADHSVKKIELAFGSAGGAPVPPSVRSYGYISRANALPDWMRAEPPLPPPRR